MPELQRGQTFKLADGSWAYRFRDKQGRRPQRGGFRTKGEASQALALALEDARLGGLGLRRDLTVSEARHALLGAARRRPGHHYQAPPPAQTGRARVRGPAAPQRPGRRARGVAQEALRRLAARRLPCLQASPRAGVALEVDRREPRPPCQEPEAEATRDHAVRELGGDRGDRDGARPPLRRHPHLRHRHRPSTGGVARARAPRCRPQGGRDPGGACLHAGAVEAVREDESPEKARTAASEGARRSGSAPTTSGTHPCSSRPPEAATSSPRSGASASGSPRFGQPASSIAASTTCGTPTRRGA